MNQLVVIMFMVSKLLKILMKYCLYFLASFEVNENLSTVSDIQRPCPFDAFVCAFWGQVHKEESDNLILIILKPLYCTFLSTCLPEDVDGNVKWNRSILQIFYHLFLLVSFDCNNVLIYFITDLTQILYVLTFLIRGKYFRISFFFFFFFKFKK